VWADYASIFFKVPTEYTEGRVYAGAMPKSHVPMDGRQRTSARTTRVTARFERSIQRAEKFRRFVFSQSTQRMLKAKEKPGFAIF
jgi:hypothetical protein